MRGAGGTRGCQTLRPGRRPSSAETRGTVRRLLGALTGSPEHHVALVLPLHFSPVEGPSARLCLVTCHRATWRGTWGPVLAVTVHVGGHARPAGHPPSPLMARPVTACLSAPPLGSAVSAMQGGARRPGARGFGVLLPGETFHPVMSLVCVQPADVRFGASAEQGPQGLWLLGSAVSPRGHSSSGRSVFLGRRRWPRGEMCEDVGGRVASCA